MKKYLLLILLFPIFYVAQKTINLPNKQLITYEMDFEKEAVEYLSESKNLMSLEQQKFYFLKLDYVSFKLGIPELEANYSDKQIQNLIKIINAFDVKKITIICFTFRGDTISQSVNYTQMQANAFKNELLKRNVKCEITAIGGGYSFAKASSNESMQTKGAIDRGVFINFE